MSNEVQLEISQNTAAMQGMAAAIDKVAASTAKLSRQQGTLKTTGKESLDALRAMQAGIDGFGSGLAGLASAVQNMNTNLSSAMREMAASISKGFGGMGAAALQAGEETSKNLAAGIGKGKGLVAQEVKKLQLEYEAALRSGGSFSVEGLGFLKTRGVSLVPDDRAALANTALAIKGRKEAEAREAEIDKAYAQHVKQRAAIGMEALKAEEGLQLAKIKFAQDADDAALARSKAIIKAREAEMKVAAKIEVANFEAMLDAKLKLEQLNAAKSATLSKLRTAELRAYLATPEAAMATVGYQPANKSRGATAAAFLEADAQAKAHANLAAQANGSKLALAENAAGMKIWTGHANDAHSAARGLASGFGAMWLTWGNIIPLLAGAAVSHTIAGVVKQGAEVNHIMETMRVLAQQTAQETELLNAQLVTLASSGPIGPKAVAEGMKQLALAGLKVGDASSAIHDVINLSVAGEIDMKKAADSLTGIGAAFNIDARGYNYIADVISKTAAVSKASVESVTDAMKYASVIHKQYGVSLEDTGLAVALLNNLNIQGTAAGTALRNMYVDLSGRSSAARAEFKRLGVEVLDSKGKFLDFISVVKALDEGLKKETPKAQQRSKQILLSERGGKPAVEALELLNTPALDSKFSNRLVELKAEMANFEGFAIESAAKLAGTAQNQMKTVQASYQTALVEAFKTAEPYILNTATSLKNLFNSNDFKEALTSVVYGVGEAIKFFMEWGNTIWTVIRAYAAWKVAQLAMNVVMVASTAIQARANVTMLAASPAAAAAALGYQGAATAISGFATATMAGFAGILRFLNPVIGLLTLAYTAWQLFGSSKKEAFDEAKDAAAINTLDAYNEKLRTETERLQASNRAYEQRITLQQLLEKEEKERIKDAAAKSSAALDVKLQAKQREFDKASENTNIHPKALKRVKDELLDLQEQKRGLRLKEIASEQLQKEKDWAAKQNTANEKAKQEASRLAEHKGGTLGMPPEGALSVLAMHETDQLNALSAALDKQLSTLQDHNSKVASALENKHKNHLLTDSQFYVAKSVQDEAAYISEKKAVQDRYATEISAVTAAQQRALKRLGRGDMEGQSAFATEMVAADFLLMRDAEFNTRYPNAHERAQAKGAVNELDSLNKYSKSVTYKYQESSGKQEAAYTLQQEQANNALAGSYRNIELSIEALDKQMVGHHAQVMGQQADSLISRPFEQPWEKAGREQHKASIKKYADDIARQQETIDIANKRSEDNLKEALASGNFEAYVKALDERSQAITKLAAAQEKLDRTKAQSEGFASQQAEEAKKTAFKNEMMVFQKDLATGVSGAISTAVFEGGAQGGEQLRKFLEQMFIRKPFEIVVNATLEGMFGGEMGKAGGAALFNWAKGGLGSLFGMSAGGADSYVQSLLSGGSSGANAGYISSDMAFLSEMGFMADGGQASPFSLNRVNERGTELLSMGGKDYLMTGAQGGTVTSVRDMPSGGSTIQHNITVNIDSRADQAQVHALVVGAVQRGNAQLVDQLQQAGALSR